MYGTGRLNGGSCVESAEWLLVPISYRNSSIAAYNSLGKQCNNLSP